MKSASHFESRGAGDHERRRDATLPLLALAFALIAALAATLPSLSAGLF